MIARKSWGGLLPPILAAAALGAAALPAADAASTPPPSSIATCRGAVKPAPSSDEPNNQGYTFHCDQPISAFTLIVNQANRRNTIDDFASGPSLLLHDKQAPDPNLSWGCAGDIPGEGINCNAGYSKDGPLNEVPAGEFTEGTFDATQPYCKHLPTGARPGSLAVPHAITQLVVTNQSGAQDGPFRLRYQGTCPKVPNRVTTSIKHKRHRHRRATTRR